jgi:hypothetical protein
MAKLSMDKLRELVSPGTADSSVDAAPAWHNESSAALRSLPDRRTMSATLGHYRGIDAGAPEPSPLVEGQSEFDAREITTSEGTLRRAVVRSKESGDIIAEQG